MQFVNVCSSVQAPGVILPTQSTRGFVPEGHGEFLRNPFSQPSKKRDGWVGKQWNSCQGEYLPTVSYHFHSSGYLLRSQFPYFTRSWPYSVLIDSIRFTVNGLYKNASGMILLIFLDRQPKINHQRYYIAHVTMESKRKINKRFSKVFHSLNKIRLTIACAEVLKLRTTI